MTISALTHTHTHTHTENCRSSSRSPTYNRKAQRYEGNNVLPLPFLSHINTSQVVEGRVCSSLFDEMEKLGSRKRDLD